MPTTYTSPFAASFKSACNRGVSYNTAVENIAKRNNKTCNFVWNSLCKAGLCYRQKFNGQWIYFPCNMTKKPTKTVSNNTQVNCWQYFCEWCLDCGFCTPEQLNKCSSQTEFMNFCKKYWGRQFTTGTKTTKKSTTGRKTTTARKSTTRKSGTTKNYKFSGSKSTTRKYSRAA